MPDLILGSINSPTHQKMQMVLFMLRIPSYRGGGFTCLVLHSDCYRPTKLCARGEIRGSMDRIFDNKKR